jgi:hypothetical protein
MTRECNSSGQLWTCPSDNSSIAVVKGGKPVVVEQGPTWLVELAYGGPEWLPILGRLLFLVIVAALMIAIYRRGVTVEQTMGVVQNGLLVVSVFLLSYASRDLLALSYLGDVAVGGVGGFIVSAMVFRLLEDEIREQVEEAV